MLTSKREQLDEYQTKWVGHHPPVVIEPLMEGFTVGNRVVADPLLTCASEIKKRGDSA